MRKNDKKQRRSLLFSTAVVVTGCLLTAFYVNQEMPKSEYEVDLSQLSAEQKQEDLAGDMRTGDAGVAKVKMCIRDRYEVVSYVRSPLVFPGDWNENNSYMI